MTTTLDRDMYIGEYLQGRGYTQKHSELCHKVLMASSVLFFLSMLFLTFVARPECGGNPHFLRHCIFMFVTGFDLFAQAWVLLHSRLGYHLVIFQPRKLVAGLFLTFLGRFDTYSDVTFAGMLQNCHDINWFTIKEKYFHVDYWRFHTRFEGDRMFPLPFELAHISIISLFIGVFCCQVFPGLYMLCKNRWLQTAFKLNEFNLLLALMDVETEYMTGTEEEQRAMTRTEEEQRALTEAVGASEVSEEGYTDLTDDESSTRPLEMQPHE